MNKTFTAIAIAAGVALAACGSDDRATVAGRQDDVRHVTRKTVKDTRVVNDYTRTCTGSGSKRKCKRVKTGQHTETYQRVTRPERYCVELDDVNGTNDVWFTVSAATYYDAVERDEGDRVNAMPYTSRGC